METLSLVIATALLSSGFTVLALWVTFKVVVEDQLNQFLEVLKQKVKEGVTEAADESLPSFRTELGSEFEQVAEGLLPDFRHEVSVGFEEAAEGLLPKFREEVCHGFEEAAEDLLPKFRQEVSAGLEESAERMLPTFREELEDGLKEGLLSVASIDIVDRATKRVMQTGSTLVETGLSILRSSRS